MTPLQNILRVERSVYTQDHSGQLELVCNAANLDKARWLAWSLAKAHSVPNKYFDPRTGSAKDAEN